MIAFSTLAQTSIDKGCKPPLNRERWHNDIDKAQAAAIKAGFVKTDNEDVAQYVNYALVQRVDVLQCKIEKDSTLKDQPKVGYLRGLEKLIRNATADVRTRKFSASNFPVLLDAFESAMKANQDAVSIESIVDNLNYETGTLLLSTQMFDKNPGYVNAKGKLALKFATLYPDKVFQMLRDNPDVPFRDSLVIVAGKRDPRQLYNYAAADNALGYAIRAIEEPFIRTVSKMAKSPSGQLYFPFLDNIVKGKQSIEDIDSVKDDPVKYYKLLVKTRTDYVQRQLEGEKVIEMKALSAMLEKKAIDEFIKPINELHEIENPEIRFKVLKPLTAQELYYVAISGEQDLYTSSYVKGVYPQMMQKWGNRGDSVLQSVAFDHFKKFIKIAAGYNTLPNFLSSFPQQERARLLMTAFVNGLDKSEGLEDGVDVADSYASIVESLKPIADQMLLNVKQNYEEAVQANNKRAAVIYDLLYKLFLSATDSAINLSKEFNIPPVYGVSYNTLAGGSDTGKVIVQVFFYGGKDGRFNYSNFVPRFPANLWKRYENKQWISFTSLKGKQVVVYANKALGEEDSDEDYEAQQALDDYLAQHNLEPTIVIHRGHSYFAPTTIEQLAPTAKIVFLGSCGGYNLIHSVLEQAEDAHIIASKQIGRQMLNQPLIDMLLEKVRTGSNIDWIPFWRDFQKKYGKVEGFGDYVPPHKNLGAIFIKAYKNAMGGNEKEA